MNGNVDYVDLVEKARLGDEESMNRLATLGRESLRRYVFRLTLDEALTQDIIQEVLLEMFKILGKLKKSESFLSWLNGIAFNRIRQHYGQKWNSKMVSISDVAYNNHSQQGHEGLAGLVNKELKQIIFAAMSELEPMQRAVLSMRCYDEMSFSKISRRIGCSEFSARAFFFRAKRSFAKQLSRRGLGKGSLLTALVLFGKMTAVSEAAASQVTLTAATMKVGIAAGIAGAATGKAVVVSLAAAGAITVGTMVALPNAEPVTGSVEKEISPTIPKIAKPQSRANDLHECWYYYPAGSGGAVMMRYLIAGKEGKESYCQWLQNDAGNYFYDHRSNTIYLNNNRVFQEDYSVRQLPTDSPETSDFIAQVQGKSVEMDHIHSRARDLLVIASENDSEGKSTSWTTRHYNVLDEDYFQCDWPVGAKTVDNRDQMHKRGWTYFKIEGQLEKKVVSGVGQLPFLYGVSHNRKPWLRLHVGEYEVWGDLNGIIICNSDRKVIKSWSGRGKGGIFAGLGRPWMGLHVIDTVRRDAASKMVWFETKVVPETGKANVTLSCDSLKMNYRIDLARDVIEEIEFVSETGEVVGQLNFTYIQDINSMSDIPVARRVRPNPDSQQGEGILWLAGLAEGKVFGDE